MMTSWKSHAHFYILQSEISYLCPCHVSPTIFNTDINTSDMLSHQEDEQNVHDVKNDVKNGIFHKVKKIRNKKEAEIW